MRRSVLICPEYFGACSDGIGRVSGACADALSLLDGETPFVLASNDPMGGNRSEDGEGFGSHYASMLLAVIFSRRFSRSAIVSRSDSLKTGIIVCTHLGLAPVARALAARRGVPYIVFMHGIEAWKSLRGRRRWGLRRAHCLLFNSRYTLRRFLAFNAWANDLPSRVVPLGVAASELGSKFETPKPFTSGAPDFTLLTVGRMAKEEYHEDYHGPTDLYKGFKLVVSAIAILREEGVPARLELVGDGSARGDLERWVAASPVAAFVRFHGRVSDAELSRHYSRADVFVLPSENEGFGLVYAEAMAHGLPCLAVSAGAVPEVVDDDQAGFVVRPRDPYELADRLRVLACNPRVYARLSAGARARYLRHYTQEAFVERLVAATEEKRVSRSSTGVGLE